MSCSQRSPRLDGRLGTVLRAVASRIGLILFGVLLALVFLESGMRLAGCMIRFAQSRRNQRALARKHQLRVLCLGESTTEGDGEHGRYPEMLGEILNRQSLGGRIVVVNRGRSGADTKEILLLLEKDLDEYEPDLVVAMMGINDVGRTHAYGTMFTLASRHWYGSLRVYKLYLWLHSALERRSAAEAPLVRGRGIPLAPPPETPAPAGTANGVGLTSADPYALGELPPEVSRLVDEGPADSAARALEDLLRAHPDLPVAYLQLDELYRRDDRLEEAHRALLRGVAEIPDSVLLHAALASSYEARGELQKAIETVRRIFESLLLPNDENGQNHYRIDLASLYEKAGRLDLAEKTLREVVDRNPGNDILYQVLIDFYERQGRTELAARHREIQRRIRYEYVNPTTRRHYRQLRDALRRRGIPLIAVQYPGRSAEELWRMLDADDDVVFVDNTFFRERVEADGYDAYFYDDFAGDFGHLTRRGNRLLAENVARAIVEEHFGLPFVAGKP